MSDIKQRALAPVLMSGCHIVVRVAWGAQDVRVIEDVPSVRGNRRRDVARQGLQNQIEEIPIRSVGRWMTARHAQCFSVPHFPATAIVHAPFWYLVTP